MKDHSKYEQVVNGMRERLNRIKNGLIKTANHAAQWVSENRELIAIATPFVLSATGSLYKEWSRVKQKRTALEIERKKATRVWDPSLGFYWTLKRPMTSEEQIEFSIRRQYGENTGDILRKMRIL